MAELEEVQEVGDEHAGDGGVDEGVAEALQPRLPVDALAIPVKRPPCPSKPEKPTELLFVPGSGDEGTGRPELGVDVALGPALDVLDRLPARHYLVVGLEALAGVVFALVALDGVVGGVRKGFPLCVELGEAMLKVPIPGVSIRPRLLSLKDKINFYPGEFKNLGLLGGNGLGKSHAWIS